LGARRLHREHGAGFYRLAVDMHDAGAALRGVAADMRSGKPEILTQEMYEQRPVLDRARYFPAIHYQRYVRHGSSLISGPEFPDAPIPDRNGAWICTTAVTGGTAIRMPFAMGPSYCTFDRRPPPTQVAKREFAGNDGQ